MTPRLTLSTTGIKNPLEITTEQPQPDQDTLGERGHSRESSEKLVTEPVATATKPANQVLAAASFYGGGRPRQTSIALNRSLSQRLDELARAAAVSRNSLAIAAIHRGVPHHAELAHKLILTERLARIDSREPRHERNLRLPEQLIKRLDELLSAAQTATSRATRADLVNAALTIALPANAQAAAELVAEQARQRERQRTINTTAADAIRPASVSVTR